MPGGKRKSREAKVADSVMTRSGFMTEFIHPVMESMLARATPPWATTRASESMRAAAVAEVRRGAWMRLSAASAPSIGRIHFSGRRRRRASASERVGANNRPASTVNRQPEIESRAVARRSGRHARAAMAAASAATRRSAILARAQHLVAAFLQGLDGLDARGIARRDEGGDHAHGHTHGDRQQEESRVDQNFAGVVGDAEQLVHQVAGDAGEAARERQARGRADGRPDEAGDGALGEEQGADLGARGAQGAQDSDLRAALGHGDGEGIVDDEHPDEQGEEAGDAGDRGIDGQQRFELAAAAGRGLDGEARGRELSGGPRLLRRARRRRGGRYRCGRSGGRGRRRSAAA